MTIQSAEIRDVTWARRVTERLRLRATTFQESYDKLEEAIAEARDGGAWDLLGYSSWTAYVADVFKDEPMILQRDARREIVAQLAGEGMSNRAIGSVVGADERTVRRDLSGAAHAAPEPTGSTVVVNGTIVAQTEHVDLTTGEVIKTSVSTIPQGEPVSRDVGMDHTSTAADGGEAPAAVEPPVVSRHGIDHHVTIDGEFVGLVSEYTKHATHLRFVAAAAGNPVISLGWHSTLSDAIATITAVHSLACRAGAR